MKWFLVFAAVFALLFAPGVCAPVHAQHCEDGVCQLGAPLVAMPGPFFGPVILQPAPVYCQNGQWGGMPCQPAPVYCQNGQWGSMPCQPAPGVVYGCNGPQCRPAPNDFRYNHEGNRGGSVGVGLSLNWNRTYSGRHSSRWR